MKLGAGNRGAQIKNGTCPGCGGRTDGRHLDRELLAGLEELSAHNPRLTVEGTFIGCSCGAPLPMGADPDDWWVLHAASARGEGK